MLQTTLYRKQTFVQNCPKARSDSQALRIKQICSLLQEFLSHTAEMINQFQKREYNRSLIEEKIDEANLQEREQLLKEKKKLQQISLYRSNTIEHSLY